MREIDKYSDLNVDYTLKKTGKQFTSIVFRISSKKDMMERFVTWQNINSQISPQKTARVANEATDLGNDLDNEEETE